MDKLERQLGLLAALLHTEQPLRAADIHSQVSGYPDDLVAFRRAFERDKEELRRLGIPIELQRTETIDGPVDGYRVAQSDYYLHDLGLEPDEVVALSVALRVIRLEGGAADDAIWKLGGFDADAGSDLQLAAIAIAPAVTQVHEAISSKATVTFEYRGEERVVEPWRVAFRRGQWYVHGYDQARDDARSFRFDRIEGSVVIGGANSATHPRSTPTDDRRPWQFTTEDDETYRAHVAIDASHARWAEHHLRDATVVSRRDDGAIELELDVANPAAFRSMILSMGAAAEILGPPVLRDDMIRWLDAMVGS